MQSLAFKTLFQKKGRAAAILAIALLIALLASVNCLLNNINSETTLLTKLPSISQTYLLTSKNSSSLYDSQIDASLIDQFHNNPNIAYVTSQQISPATLITKNGNYTINILAVDNLQTFLNKNQASINGSISQNEAKTNMGIILSQLTSTQRNDSLNLMVNDKLTQLKIVGIIQTNQQSDTELIMPLSTLQTITQNNSTVSFIEFTLRDSNGNKAIENVTQNLPSDTKVIELQQATDFVRSINSQTTAFINLWSITAYTVVIATSYTAASRLVTEAKYEISMLRVLGAKKKTTASLIVANTVTLAFIGSVIGVSMGIVGTQIVATGIRWFWGNSFLAPFLQPDQALLILALTLIFSLIGSMYPAIKSIQNRTTEQQP